MDDDVFLRRIPTRCPTCDKLEPCGNNYCAKLKTDGDLDIMIGKTVTAVERVKTEDHIPDGEDYVIIHFGAYGAQLTLYADSPTLYNAGA